MNSRDVLKLLIQIGSTSSRTAKEDLLRAQIEDPLVQRVVRHAYDPFITFGLTPPEPPAVAGPASFSDSSGQPWQMLHNLATRQLTGNAAKAAVEAMFKALDAESAALLWRILRKDLRCGITEKTINTVLPGTVPTFDVMLSKPFEEKRVKAWPIAVEPKLDGLRAMCIVKDGTAKFFSRVGNHFPALDHLGELMVQIVTDAWQEAKRDKDVSKISEVYYRFLGGDAGPSCAIDSEVTTGSFNKTSGDVKRKSEEATDALINVFDALPVDKMLASDTPEIKIPFKLRRGFAQWIVKKARAGAPIQMTPMEMCHKVEEIYDVYNRHRAAGLEGAMVKPLDASYVKKKGFLWMKMKAQETADLRIVGWQTGEPGTRNEGKFATFIVDFEGVHVSVGGMTQALMEEMDAFVRTLPSQAPTQVKNKTRTLFVDPWRLMEVEYHEVTPDGSLRHPRFVRFRDDKDEQLRIAA
ncbi:hypothetical protein [Methylobacterium sp. AMS5]|uniref:ATP-dependent DNA ligase n=1 Tax=Methylobacterium sp. AMS5 TaxID=925818 RepID=UPI00074F8A28|nr:hypothetical protein [Methylobacterium sp. AMS5]AMB48230.1 hypothetical protein Y590_25010 [Methylobacterium sp. AMS5]